MFKFILLLSAVLCLSQAASIAKGSGKLVKLGLKYYFIEPHADLDFIAAVEYCNIHHLGLVAIEDREENEQLLNQVADIAGPQHANLWTSGNRLDRDEWVWLTTGKPIEDFDWEDRGEPHEDDRCLALGYNDAPHQRGWWKGVHCDERAGVVCETPIPDPEPQPDPEPHPDH